MNLKKSARLLLAVFITLFLTDLLIHGVILKSHYIETQALWRTEADMPLFLSMMVLGQALLALFFSWIFVHGYKGGGLGEGVRYGLLIGGFMAGNHLVMYSVAPYSLSMVLGWIGLGTLQATLAGVVAVKVWVQK